MRDVRGQGAVQSTSAEAGMLRETDVRISRKSPNLGGLCICVAGVLTQETGERT